MNTTKRIQLSIMMFLEFFIWGSWFVTMGTYLGNTLKADGAGLGQAYGTQSLGAIIAPFFIGLIADRFFNAERILGVLHLIGGVLMWKLSGATEFSTFYPYLLMYMIVYMPTLALVNSVSFNQMSNPAKEFSNIRVWGTVGWIVAGLVISYIFHWDSQDGITNGLLKNTFMMTAIVSFILGIMSFTLPATPPKPSTEKKNVFEILGLDSLKLFGDRNFLIFFISSILICIPLAFYYQHANQFLTEINVSGATGKMTLGQISEVGFMLLLPWFFMKFGFKKTIMVGMFAWALRYFMFAYGSGVEFILLLGITLHGICYDFFFVSGQIYTDSKAGEKYKSSAQGLITLATYGIGMLIGFAIAGRITDYFKLEETGHDWQQIWRLPALFAGLVMLIFAFFFKDEEVSYK